MEIVPDYGQKIRVAREGLGLSPEDLGAKIKEKAALIKKIEREEISPEDRIRKKLEKERRETGTAGGRRERSSVPVI